MPKVTNALKTFECACGKSYAHAPNLTRHKKTCNHTTESTKTITQTDEIAELKAIILRMEKKVDALTAYIMKKETNAYDITQAIIEKVEKVEKIEEIEEIEEVEETIATNATDFKKACLICVEKLIIPKEDMTVYSMQGTEGFKQVFKKALIEYPNIFKIVPRKQSFSIGEFYDHVQVCKSNKWSTMTELDTCKFFNNLWDIMRSSLPNYYYDREHKDYDCDMYDFYYRLNNTNNIYEFVIADVKVELLEMIKDINQPIIETVNDIINDIVTDVVKVEKKPKAQKLPKAPVAPKAPKPEKLPKLGKKAHKQNDEDDEYKESVETHATNATIATDATDFKTICRTHIAGTIPQDNMVGYAYEGKEGYKKLLTRVLTSNPKIFQIVPFKLTGDLIPLKGEKPINVFSVGVFEDHIQVCKSKKWSKMTRDDTCQFFYNLWIAMVDNYHHDENFEGLDYETHELYSKDIDDINIYSMLIADMKVEILEIIKEFS